MPKRRKNKRKRRKKHKDNTQEANKNSNLKQVICAFFRNIFQKDINVSEIADLVLVANFSDYQLSDMIRTLWSDPDIDSKKIDCYTEILLIIISTRPRPIKLNASIANVLKFITMKLFKACIEPKRLSYVNECAKWCLEFTKSYPQAIHYFENACQFFNKNHFMKIYKDYIYLQANKIIKMRMKNEIFGYLNFISYLFNHNLITSSCIYYILPGPTSDTMHVLSMHILFCICNLCWTKLYAESNVQLLGVVSQAVNLYTKCNICHRTPIEPNKPMHTPCDHIFCDECISKYINYQKQNSSKLICPHCDAPSDSNAFKSSLPFYQEILNLCNSYSCVESEPENISLCDNNSEISSNQQKAKNRTEINDIQNDYKETKLEQETISQTSEQKFEMQPINNPQIEYNKLPLDSCEWNDTKTEEYENMIMKKQNDIDKLNVKCKTLEHSMRESISIRDAWKEKYNGLKNVHQLLIEEHKLAQLKTHQEQNKLKEKYNELNNLNKKKQSDMDKLNMKYEMLEGSLQKSISKKNKWKEKYNGLKIVCNELEAKHNHEQNK
eukprot:111123_1